MSAPLVLVVGDVMLDVQIHGSVSRVAPEAPVPVVYVEGTTDAAGGAANVAANIVSLGGHALLTGLVGLDTSALRLEACIPTVAKSLLKSEGPTTTKTRIYAGRQLVARYDQEAPAPHAKASLEHVTQLFRAYKPDLVVVSDYGKGVINPELFRGIIELGRQYEVSVIVDPKSSDFTQYRGADILKPNEVEARAAAARLGLGVESAPLSLLGPVLRDAIGVKGLLITRGVEGMDWFSAGVHLHCPAWHPLQVFDVQGCGDTVCAALVVALAEERPAQEALRFAAVAGGLAASKPGTAAVTREEVDRALGERPSSNNKILRGLTELAVWAAQQKALGLKVGLANGCFDLLHFGHLHLLRSARAKCDKLLVAVNSDTSVRALKGPTRPAVPEQQRIEMIAALDCTDAAVIFEGEVQPVVEALVPAVLFKGSEYVSTMPPGGEFVIANEGRVEFIPQLPGLSTTSLIGRVSEKQDVSCSAD